MILLPSFLPYMFLDDDVGWFRLSMLSFEICQNYFQNPRLVNLVFFQQWWKVLIQYESRMIFFEIFSKSLFQYESNILFWKFLRTFFKTLGVWSIYVQKNDKILFVSHVGCNLLMPWMNDHYFLEDQPWLGVMGD